MDNECPTFEKPDLLEWHSFLNHMPPSDDGNFECIVGLMDYEHHLRKNGGVWMHYHASSIGVKP